MNLIDHDSDVPRPPAAKRIKFEKIEASEELPAAVEASRTKYKNSDLPAGCLDGNAWRGIFIPTIAHTTGGDNIHPWLIEDDILIPILMKAWNVIYAGSPSLADHPIVPGGAVYYVVCLANRASPARTAWYP